MGVGASGHLPSCEDLQILQKEEIDDGAVVLELQLEPESDPRQLTQRIFSVPSSLFEASIRLPAKHGGLLEPMPLEWRQDELIFVVSGDYLVAQAACKAALPEEVRPETQKWANACIDITYATESLHSSLSYLQAKPRKTKSSTSVSYALWLLLLTELILARSPFLACTDAITSRVSEEQTATLLSAFFAVSRRLKRLVFLSRDGSNELDLVSWCADLATTELSVFALSYLFSRVLRKQFVPALNLRTVAAKLRLEAEAGDRDTQFLLAQVLLSGMGVEKDEAEAMKWMLRAADRNLVKAQAAYGRSLLIGQYGLTKDVEKAMSYLKRAAIAGDSESQTVLGLCYTSRTFPTEHENAEGVRLFTMAAESGNVVAQCKLGHCYLSGRGGLVSEEKAMEWYTRAAEAGLAEAQNALGVLLAQRGQKERAEMWLQKAAAQGSLDAQSQLDALKSGICIVS